MTNNLSTFGCDAKIPRSPDHAVLDKVLNSHTNTNYENRFSCPEFTSICPVTGQPDFAHLVIDYVADQGVAP